MDCHADIYDSASKPNDDLGCLVTHVYLCGHVEVDELPQSEFDENQYVFVEGTCSASHCLDGSDLPLAIDADPEADQLTTSLLAEQLHRIKHMVRASVDSFDAMAPLLTDEIVAGYPDVVDVLTAEYRGEAINKHFHLAEASGMLRNMRRFGKQVYQKPFWDYCHREVRFCLDDAEDREKTLLHVLGQLQRSDVVEFEQPSHWLGYGSYEPEFGVDELKLLRSSVEGRDLLSQSFNPNMLRLGSILVDCLKQQAAATATKYAAAKVQASEDLKTWLQQEEKAFQAELAAKRKNSLESNKAPKRLVRGWVRADPSLTNRALRPLPAIK